MQVYNILIDLSDKFVSGDICPAVTTTMIAYMINPAEKSNLAMKTMKLITHNQMNTNSSELTHRKNNQHQKST
jgi:hypothetical protein